MWVSSVFFAFVTVASSDVQRDLQSSAADGRLLSLQAAMLECNFLTVSDC